MQDFHQDRLTILGIDVTIATWLDSADYKWHAVVYGDPKLIPDPCEVIGESRKEAWARLISTFADYIELAEPQESELPPK